MMKKIVLCLLVITFLMTACYPIQKNSRNDVSYLSEKSEMLSASSNETEEYTIDKLFAIFRNNEGIYAVTEDGEVYDVEKDSLINISDRSGDVLRSLDIRSYSDGREIASCSKSIITRYPIPIYATPENAPYIYANYMLGQKMYNGYDDAISDFKINSIGLIENNPNIIKFKINFNFKPACYATAYEGYNPFNETYGNIVEFTNQEITITLVGMNNSWVNINSDFNGVDFPNQSDKFYTATSKKHKLAENQYVLFEDNNYTYWWEKSNNSEDKGTFTSSVYSYRHSDGEIKTIICDAKNLEFYFKDYSHDKILLTTINNVPFSEAIDGPLYFIDEKQQNAAKVECLELFAINNNKVFFAGKYDNNLGGILYTYNYDDGKITSINNLELEIKQPYSDNKEPYLFCFYENELLWSDNIKWYKLNIGTGFSTEFVWNK